MNPFHHTLEQALRLMPGPAGDQYAILLEHGTLEVGMYSPRVIDDQTPHTRDEVYVVMRGSGQFQNGSDRVSFGPGDVLFVPAHQEHRFEDFTDDFAAWVFFYGPQGGEVDKFAP
jgi:mannose-6-phosphate isomerase-like protein (cupin superfamily)